MTKPGIRALQSRRDAFVDTRPRPCHGGTAPVQPAPGSARRIAKPSAGDRPPESETPCTDPARSAPSSCSARGRCTCVVSSQCIQRARSPSSRGRTDEMHVVRHEAPASTSNGRASPAESLISCTHTCRTSASAWNTVARAFPRVSNVSAHTAWVGRAKCAASREREDACEPEPMSLSNPGSGRPKSGPMRVAESGNPLHVSCSGLSTGHSIAECPLLKRKGSVP